MGVNVVHRGGAVGSPSSTERERDRHSGVFFADSAVELSVVFRSSRAVGSDYELTRSGGGGDGGGGGGDGGLKGVRVRFTSMVAVAIVSLSHFSLFTSEPSALA